MVRRTREKWFLLSELKTNIISAQCHQRASNRKSMIVALTAEDKVWQTAAYLPFDGAEPLRYVVRWMLSNTSWSFLSGRRLAISGTRQARPACTTRL